MTFFKINFFCWNCFFWVVSRLKTKERETKQATCCFVKPYKTIFFLVSVQVFGLLRVIGVPATSVSVSVTASPFGTFRSCHCRTNTPVDSRQLLAFILMFMFAFFFSWGILLSSKKRKLHTWHKHAKNSSLAFWHSQVHSVLPYDDVSQQTLQALPAPIHNP